MGRYEDWTLTVGTFSKDGTEHTNQVRFKGRLLANGEEVTFATRDGAIRETEWEIYQIDDGKYLVCWFHWVSAWGAPSVSDYVILDNFPVYDQTFVGTFLGNLCGIYPTTSSTGQRLWLKEERSTILGYENTKEEEE